MIRQRVIAVGLAVVAGGEAVAVWAQAPPPPPPRQPQQQLPPPAGGQPQQPQQQFDVRQFIAQFDRNRDGFLDINEVPPEMRAVFNQIDTNRDGRLSAEELRQFFARNPPQPPPNVPLADAVIDTALDATHDPNELADLQRAYELMKVIDANNDGRITAEEVRAARPRLIERRADAIIREFDTDRDGRISRQEAKGQLAQDFDRLDTNRDGFIDKAEMIRALTAQIQAAQPPGNQPATAQPLPPRPNPPPGRP